MDLLIEQLESVIEADFEVYLEEVKKKISDSEFAVFEALRPLLNQAYTVGWTDGGKYVVKEGLMRING